jgi:hypothetical protein
VISLGETGDDERGQPREQIFGERHALRDAVAGVDSGWLQLANGGCLDFAGTGISGLESVGLRESRVFPRLREGHRARLSLEPDPDNSGAGMGPTGSILLPGPLFPPGSGLRVNQRPNRPTRTREVSGWVGGLPGKGWAMTDKPHETPRNPIEEWTDQELIDQYRYLLAEMADIPDGDSDDESAVEIARHEIIRRGLSEHLDEVDEDAESPGREPFDPRLRDDL